MKQYFSALVVYLGLATHAHSDDVNDFYHYFDTVTTIPLRVDHFRDEIGPFVFSPDSSKLFTVIPTGPDQPDDESIAIYDTKSWKRQSIGKSKWNVFDPSISPDGSMLAASCSSQSRSRHPTIELWRTTPSLLTYLESLNRDSKCFGQNDFDVVNAAFVGRAEVLVAINSRKLVNEKTEFTGIFFEYNTESKRCVELFRLEKHRITAFKIGGDMLSIRGFCGRAGFIKLVTLKNGNSQQLLGKQYRRSY